MRLVVGAALTMAACSPSPPSAVSDASVEAATEPVRTFEEYPDFATRQMWRRASEPRPVERSALPPRHLDVELFPDVLVERTRIDGGVPADAIPAIDHPKFQRAETVDWLDKAEAVITLRVGDHVRVYPVQVMMWHEIVNDRIAGLPVVVTYCPLCNSAVAFERRVDGRLLEFGTSGALYQSALVMYDRQTETLWTHFDGRAVVGTLIGAQLEFIPVSTVAWDDVRRAHPDAQVLTRDTGYNRSYGRNPYVGYDQLDKPLTGSFSGDVDARAKAMTRVVGVHVDGDSLAVPTDVLSSAGVVDAELDGARITLWHVSGTASPLHRRSVTEGEDVGATGVFIPVHNGRQLRFHREDDRFIDAQTHSSWNILGEAVDGPLTGERLEAVPHVDTFWFAWSTYRPGTALVE